MFAKDFTRNVAPGAFLPVCPAFAATGLSGGTLVETATGWQKAADLRLGQRLQTLDGGPAPIVAVDRRIVTDQRAVCIPGGLADNCADLILPADQHVLIDTLGDVDLPDAAFVLCPVAAWLGLPGVQEVRLSGEVVTPLFAAEEIVWANSGTLLHCPAISHGVGHLPDGFFHRMPLDAARRFLARRAARLG